MSLFLVPANAAQAKDVNPEDCYFGSTIQDPGKEVRVDCKELNKLSKRQKDEKTKLEPNDYYPAFNKAAFDCEKNDFPPKLKQCVSSGYCLEKKEDEPKDFDRKFICTRAWRATTTVSTNICAALETAKNADRSVNVVWWNENDGESVDDNGKHQKNILTPIFNACKKLKACTTTIDGKVSCKGAVEAAKDNKSLSKDGTSDASTPVKVDLSGDDGENDKDPVGQTCKQHAGIFAFLVCPGLNLMASLIDQLVQIVADNIKWTVLADTTGSGGNSSSVMIRAVWESVLGIANIALAIAFVVMLYKYAVMSHNGNASYDIKTLLPRLIVVAIAMNLSFYICAAAADLSNVMGSGVYQLIMKQIVDPGNGPFSTAGLSTAIGTIAGLAVLIIAAILNFGIFIMLALMILAMVTLRQIALIVLVIASPFAFACYLLPNTEKWFKKWFETFSNLLIIYPFFTAAWAGAHLLAYIAESLYSDWGFIIAPLCAAAPLAAILPIFKMSSSLMKSASKKFTNAANKQGITDFAKRHDQNRRNFAKNVAQTKSIGLQRKLNSGGRISRGMGAIVGSLNGTRFAAANKRNKEDTDNLVNNAISDINYAKDNKKKKKNNDNNNNGNNNNQTSNKKSNNAEKPNTNNVELNVDANQAANIAKTLGIPELPSSTNSKGQKVYHISGNMLIKYKAMSGKDANGRTLGAAEYQSVLNYALSNNIVNKNNLMETIYDFNQGSSTRAPQVPTGGHVTTSAQYTPSANHTKNDTADILTNKSAITYTNPPRQSVTESASNNVYSSSSTSANYANNDAGNLYVNKTPTSNTTPDYNKTVEPINIAHDNSASGGAQYTQNNTSYTNKSTTAHSNAKPINTPIKTIMAKSAISTPHYVSSKNILHNHTSTSSINAKRKGAQDAKFKTW